jgi:ribose 5-phosphate isomerase B
VIFVLFPDQTDTGKAGMIIVIGADHGGYHLKNLLVNHLSSQGHSVKDVGTHNEEPVDYPDYARAIAEAFDQGKAERGILICGSGVGAGIAMNKFPGIRAGLCHDTFSAHQGVEDDDMNVLCLGARVVGPELAKDIVTTFLAAHFSGAARHVRRVGKIAEIEKECAKDQGRGAVSPGSRS